MAKQHSIVNIQLTFRDLRGLNLPFQVFSGPVLSPFSPYVCTYVHVRSGTLPVALSAPAMGWESVAGPWMVAMPLWAAEHR